MRKIVFTGGHHNSALAVAKSLVARGEYSVTWYGHKYTMRGNQSVSAEFQEVTASQIKFRELKAGKLYKTYNPVSFLKIPFGFFQAYWYLLLDQPDLIVSFGGYLAAPVVLAAFLMGIPIITHEQTTSVGFANRFISLMANEICVTWPQTKQYLGDRNIVVTGLPLRPEIFQVDDQKFKFNNDLPTVYITGGKQGSHAINLVTAEVLPELLKICNVIHQCGAHSEYQDIGFLKESVHKLGAELQGRYIVQEYFFESKIGSVFAAADLIVSRAGAHTVYEIAALGKPALFIPISWVSHNEQFKNARLLVNEGSAYLLPENRLDRITYLSQICAMLGRLNELTQNAKTAKSKIIFNGGDRVATEIEKFFLPK